MTGHKTSGWPALSERFSALYGNREPILDFSASRNLSWIAKATFLPVAYPLRLRSVIACQIFSVLKDVSLFRPRYLIVAQ